MSGADDGTDAELAYIAKLSRTNRPKKLVAAVWLLLLAMRRLQPFQRRAVAMRLALFPAAMTVARALAKYVSVQADMEPPTPRPIALALVAGITHYAVKAADTFSDSELDARNGLIVVSEVQRTTADTLRTALASSGTITRTAQAGACPRCTELAGTYHRPLPADLYWSHPRCACEWSNGP